MREDSNRIRDLRDSVGTMICEDIVTKTNSLSFLTNRKVYQYREILFECTDKYLGDKKTLRKFRLNLVENFLNEREIEVYDNCIGIYHTNNDSTFGAIGYFIIPKSGGEI